MTIQFNKGRIQAKAIVICGTLAFTVAGSGIARAQDPKPGEPGWTEPTISPLSARRVGSSPFNPPEINDSTFVVDDDAGLDTGCVFRSGGPLIFTIPVDRFIGDRDTLIANDLIGDTATLVMPVWDVDFNATGLPPGVAPERDRVRFNGNVVPGEFLTGANNTWEQNSFEIPMQWVEFPASPGSGGRPSPAENEIRIDIDVANSDEAWCVEVDWASLEIKAARPLVMAHGILSDGSTWDFWVQQLSPLGLPNSNRLNMGALDSISNNAEKIGAEVADARIRWGVDKVNLVTHSKGGLDGRHYVENADDVEQVVQIGTPNAGSPLADVVQSGMIGLGLSGLVANALVNAIAGRAGIQLTTPYMAIYNRLHGPNPNVRYTALAGDYRPDCAFFDLSCRPIQRLLLGLSGRPGDTIVPVASVHSLPYTNDRTFVSAGVNMEATHACLPTFTGCQVESRAIFDRLQDRVQAFGTTANPAASATGMTGTASEGGLIQANETRVHEIPIDQQGEVFFSLLHPAGDLEFDFVLVSPSGMMIDPQIALLDPDIGHDQGEILGGMLQVYNIADAEAGTWLAEVTAIPVSGSSAEVAFAVTGWMRNSPIELDGLFEKTFIQTGEDLVMKAVVTQAGAPIAGAFAAATIALPNDSMATVPLTDDGLGRDEVAGDGIYTGVLADTVQPGMYRVAFEASRTGSSVAPDFSRQAFDIATVSASSSSFSGDFSDFGLDTNGNGLFNELIVEAGINISDAGLFRIFGILSDENDNLHYANVLTELNAGSQTVALKFDGEAIFRNGVDGPYVLHRISLSEEDTDGLQIMPVDEIEDAHTTRFHPYQAFEHASILLTGTGASTGVDTTGNGLFNRLDVTVDVLIEIPGFYQWSARLKDVEGSGIDLSSGSGSFSQGINQMHFSFDGEKIGQNGVDGPYDVTGLLLFGAGESLVAGTVFSTDAFTANQFEGFTEDRDGDGISDDRDACPDSDLLANVVIDSCDSGVDNTLFSDGCTIADLVQECADNAINHGKFSSCVTHLTNELGTNDVLSTSERGSIQSCAAQADIP